MKFAIKSQWTGEVIFEAEIACSEDDSELHEAIVSGEGIKLTPVLDFMVARGVADYVKILRRDERLKLKKMKLHSVQGNVRSLEEEKKRLLRREKLSVKATERREASEQLRLKEFDKTVVKLDRALQFYDRWTLIDGTKLGDATKERLLKEADRENKYAKGHALNFKFYMGLAGKLKRGQRVREGVPLESAHALREAIYGRAFK